MLHVDGDAAAARDLQAQHVAVERGARVAVVALERAVRERLGDVAFAATIRGLVLPVRTRDGASLGRGLRVVILDLERVAPRLLEVDRGREVLRLGRRDAQA